MTGILEAASVFCSPVLWAVDYQSELGVGCGLTRPIWCMLAGSEHFCRFSRIWQGVSRPGRFVSVCSLVTTLSIPRASWAEASRWCLQMHFLTAYPGKWGSCLFPVPLTPSVSLVPVLRQQYGNFCVLLSAFLDKCFDLLGPGTLIHSVSGPPMLRQWNGNSGMLPPYLLEQVWWPSDPWSPH